MSINIPAETPDESTNPISVEEFERLHPAMLGAIRKAVREELELSHADGRTSADVQRTFDLQLVVPDVPLVFGDALHGIGPRRLFAWLREHGWLIKVKGSSWNMPTQKAMDLHLFEVKETTISHSDGHTTINKTPKMTGKGQTYFAKLFLAKPTQEAGA